MFFKNLFSRDIAVDTARTNYAKYERNLKRRQKQHIKDLCKSIRSLSKNGCRFITTADTYYDFVTYEFLHEIKEYFEQRGFEVKEIDGTESSWLKIIW